MKAIVLKTSRVLHALTSETSPFVTDAFDVVEVNDAIASQVNPDKTQVLVNAATLRNATNPEKKQAKDELNPGRAKLRQLQNAADAVLADPTVSAAVKTFAQKVKSVMPDGDSL
jgi:hypothetical protein